MSCRAGNFSLQSLCWPGQMPVVILILVNTRGAPPQNKNDERAAREAKEREILNLSVSSGDNAMIHAAVLQLTNGEQRPYFREGYQKKARKKGQP